VGTGTSRFDNHKEEIVPGGEKKKNVSWRSTGGAITFQKGTLGGDWGRPSTPATQRHNKPARDWEQLGRRGESVESLARARRKKRGSAKEERAAT